MKNLIATIPFVLFILTCSAQTYDSVPTEEIQIRKASGTSFMILNKDAKTIESTFGDPASIWSEYWEMVEMTVRTYEYNENLFTVHNNALLAFELYNADFSVGKADRAIRVGDNIASIANWYPNSYKNRGKDFMLLIVAFSATDPMRKSEYISIEFDPKGSITKIEILFD